MRVVLVMGIAALAAVLFTTSSAGIPPPSVVAHIAVTHLRPVAGRTFTGVTVVPVKPEAGAPPITIENVICPARIRGANLRARKQRFYEGGVGLVAITCSWHVPTSARGTLSTQVTVDSSSVNIVSPMLAWRIRRPG